VWIRAIQLPANRMLDEDVGRVARELSDATGDKNKFSGLRGEETDCF
jgi:hypothetical protein